MDLGDTPGAGILEQIGLVEPRSEATAATRPDRSVGPGAHAGLAPRLAGVALLLAGILVVVAGTTVRSPTGYDASGPRLAPVAVGGLLALLSVLLLVRTVVRPDTELRRAVGGGGAGDPLADAGGARRGARRLRPPAGAARLSSSPRRVFLPVRRAAAGQPRAPARRRRRRSGSASVVFIVFTQFLGVACPPG